MFYISMGFVIGYFVRSMMAWRFNRSIIKTLNEVLHKGRQAG